MSTALTGAERDYDFLPDPVAKIGQRIIDRECAIRLLNSQTGENVSVSRQEVVLRLRQLLEPQIEIAVLESLLQRHQLTPGPELVKSEAQSRFNLLPDSYRVKLLAELREQGLTFNAYIEQLSQKKDEQLKAAIATWLEQTNRNLFEVSDAEAEDYYRTRQGLFLIPEQVTFSRIELGKISNSRSLEQSQQLMESIAARLLQGESFEGMAEQFNERAGETQETLPRVALPKALKEILFSMRSGEISGVIVLTDSLVIVRVDKLESEHYIPFAEVKEFIKEQLLNSKIRHYLALEIRRERDKLELEFYF